MKPKRIMIWGKNTMTLPTPSSTPSTSKLLNGPAGRWARSMSASRSLASLIAFMIGRAQVKIDSNTTNISARKMSVPQTRCVRTRSRRSVQLTGLSLERCTQPAVASRIQP